MSIEISRETEARLTDEARRLGISVDELLARLLAAATRGTAPARPRPELPAWNLVRERFTGEISMTMLVEPGIVDTNVLIYALDTAAPRGTEM